MELYLREEGGSGEEARLSLGTAGERTQPQSKPAPLPRASRSVDINTSAQPSPRERRGEGDVCLSAQPHTTRRGGSRERR